MNKKSLLFLVTLSLIVLWSSCEKNSGRDEVLPEAEGKKYEISFKVTAFTQEEEPLPPKVASTKKNKVAAASDNPELDDAIENYIRRLDFFIYNSQGELVERLISPNEYSLTGKYNERYFELEAGSYTMIVVGSMGGLTYGDTTKYATAYLQPKQEIEDVFYKEYKFTVNETDVNTNMINLERIVGSLEVRYRTYPIRNVQAGLPYIFANSVSRFPFDPNGTYQYLYSEFPADGMNYPGYLLPKISGELEFGRPVDVVYRGFILPNRSGQFNCDPVLEIPASRSGDITEPDLGDVTIKPNVKVILTGGGYASQGGEFTIITADSVWAETVRQEF